MNVKKLIRYGKFALLLAAFAILGAGSQILLARYDDQLVNLCAALLRQFRQYALILTVAVFLIFLCGTLVNDWRARKLFASQDESSDDSYALDRAAAYAQCFASSGEIIMILLLGLFASKDTLHPILVVPLCVVFLFILMFMEIRSVNLQKKIAPEKKGDPLNFHFEKDWLESCDEAEKFAVYRASYKSFMLLKKVLPLFVIITMIAYFTLDAGPLPFLITGILWLIHTLSYIRYTVQLSENGSSQKPNCHFRKV